MTTGLLLPVSTPVLGAVQRSPLLDPESASVRISLACLMDPQTCTDEEQSVRSYLMSVSICSPFSHEMWRLVGHSRQASLLTEKTKQTTCGKALSTREMPI